MKSLRILIVEDNLLLGSLLAEMLREIGHVVCGIETTEPGAIKAALTVKPDLMIVDVRLGSGSGIAAVAAISQVTAIPHIIMTGDRRLAGQHSTITLLKPFMERDLVDAIDRSFDMEG